MNDYLLKYWKISQSRHNASDGLDYQDWFKTQTSKRDKSRRNITNKNLNVEAIDAIKLQSNVEVVKFILYWVDKGHYKSPIQELDSFQGRWLRVLAHKKPSSVNEENCKNIADLFRRTESEYLLDLFRVAKNVSRQGGTDDQWEIEWRREWKFTKNEDHFISHLSNYTPFPMIFKGSDISKWKIIEKLDCAYSFNEGKKKPDVIISHRGWLIIGERKNIADQGTAQKQQVEDAIRFTTLTNEANGIIGLAIFIGTYWDVYDNSNTLKYGRPGVIHTACLIDFVNNLSNYDGNKWKNI